MVRSNRDTLPSLVGRRIDHIFLVQGEHFNSLYLHFDDETYVELWGDFDVSSYLRGGTVELLRGDFAGKVEFEEFGEVKRKERRPRG